MQASRVDALEDPLSLFAAEELEKEKEQKTRGGKPVPDSFADLFSDIFLEAREALSPLGKDLKSAAASAADYLMQQATQTTASSSSSSLSSTTDANVEDSLHLPNGGDEDLAHGDSAADDEVPLLSGEQKLMSLKDAYIQVSSGRLLPGTLCMTNYRIAFVPSPSYLAILATTNPSVHAWLNVPLASIDRVEKEKRMKDARGAGVALVITCKDVRQHRITTNVGEYEIDRAFSTMSAYAFPDNMRHLFAFSHSLSPSSSSDRTSAADPYNPIQEYSRQGVIDVVTNTGIAGVPQDSLWRMSMANKDYRLCKTYPQYMVMPRGMSDEELFQVAAFRSGRRLPTMSWGDKESGASIWRSAQPKAGVSGTCAQDENFLEMLSQSCMFKRDPLGNRKVVADPVLHIVDCRPRSSAMANRATGAGYESQANYPYVRLEFYNIGNIHVMRDSFKSIISLVLSPSPPSGDVHFSRLVEDTQWLVHLRLIIKASWDTASFIRKGMPVLVHCSHGWDRTAQVCSLAQLFLDSHYRTIDGFKTLVEKEWISFGHPFEMRCAHAQPRASRQEDQMAPVFLQFLDCVWQIMRQQQHFFEFNTRYLLTLADHIYSCRFGTFLFNSDHDRDTNLSRNCVDIWSYLDGNRAAFTSPLYMNPFAENTITTHVFLPPLPQILRNLTVWTDYFMRFSPYPPSPAPGYRYATGGRGVDFDVYPSVCSEDAWEAAASRLSPAVVPANWKGSGVEPALTAHSPDDSPPSNLATQENAPLPPRPFPKPSKEDDQFFI